MQHAVLKACKSGLSLLLLLIPFSTLWAASSPEQQAWSFRALLDDQPIGHHHFVLQEHDGQRLLKSNADFEVKLLFLSVYEYQHRALERWGGNCLQEISARTADNGEEFHLKGKQKTAAFVVSSQLGESELPGCVMSFAYWNPAILEQNRLLNPQTGEYEAVDIRYLARDTITIDQRSVAADRYELRTPDQRITLWYSANDQRWLGLEAQLEDGYTLRYELSSASAWTAE